MKKQAIRLNKNYIVVESWMTQELRLSGNELLVYAIIYGFSQTKNQVCTCGDEYMATWLNVATRSIVRSKNQLIARKLIEKVYNDQDKRKCGYIAICPQIGDKMSCNLGDNLSCKLQKIGDNLSCNSGEIGDKMSRVMKKYVTKCHEIGDKMSRASLDNTKYSNKNNNTTTHARTRARGITILSGSDDYPRGLRDKEQAEADWKPVLSKLEADINSLGFDVWIKPLIPIGYYDETLVLISPSAASRDEVINRYADKIAAAMTGA